jgi:hypothetical protein
MGYDTSMLRVTKHALICTESVHIEDRRSWRIAMDVLSYSDTRANLKEVMDRVVEDRAPVVITRQKRVRGDGFSVGLACDGRRSTFCLAHQRRAPAQIDRATGRGTSVRADADRAVKLIFSEQAWEDYLHWQAADQTTLDRVNALIKECQRTPFKGRESRNR